ncbi:LysR family transcriptional regulator [Pararobbsia alpina]|uniref:HTH-type transcriptional regulator MetR n=1 Tax=Pararobbsia alpina TaxID=621374 RepID=A0A6S7BF68_9BURK|nr:LysR family transcriptional regulator [Pararobbsia alpina]CAB3796373.1 HTH-type transcriptional regulator MetR [Pararobbsia alpina]
MRRLDNIDLRLLRIYTTLVDAGSFFDAGVALNLSQPTLSTHLATLEQRLGERLCERGRKGFRLTPFGEVTYNAAQTLFGEINRFNERVSNPASKVVDRLAVGIIDGVVTNPKLGLQAAIGEFLKTREVFIDLDLGTPRELERAILTGERDLVIGPVAQSSPDVTYVALHREPHALYCGKDHPFFELPAQKLSRKLLDESLFSIRGYRNFDDLYRVGHRRASGSVNKIEAQTMMILSGQYVGFLPCHVGDHWASMGMMKVLKHRTYAFESQHFAAYRSADANNRTLVAFLRAVKHYAMA